MAMLLGVHGISENAENFNRIDQSTEENDGPFKATRVWNNVILHLKGNVEVRNRKHMMKTYQDCFVGSDAVDVIIDYLLHHETIKQDITRAKVERLCKYLMESNVFEDAEASGVNNKGFFEDSTSHYYRFSQNILRSNEPPCVCPSGTKCSYRLCGEDGQPFMRSKRRRSFGRSKVTKLQDVSNITHVPANDVITNPVTRLPNPEVLEGILSSGSWPESSPPCATPQRRGSKRFSSFRRSIRLTKSTSRELGLTDEEKGEIWREVIVQRLLQLVDIPSLDNILSCASQCDYSVKLMEDDKNTANIFTNTSAFGENRAVGSIDSDPWIKAAIQILEDQPEAISIINRCHSQAQATDLADLAYKIYLYQSISDIANSADRKSFVSAQLLDVISEILASLAKGKSSKAVELSQLCFLMMDKEEREKFKKWLNFMTYASKDRSIRLEVKSDNRTSIINSLTTAIIDIPLLSAIQAKNLVSFWMDTHLRIFQIPSVVQINATKRIQAASKGQSTPQTISYCQKVNDQQFKRQKLCETKKALTDLTNFIIDDTSISLKQKKQHLKMLQKHHPEVYDKYFSRML